MPEELEKLREELAKSQEMNRKLLDKIKDLESQLRDKDDENYMPASDETGWRNQ